MLFTWSIIFDMQELYRNHSSHRDGSVVRWKGSLFSYRILSGEPHTQLTSIGGKKKKSC